jgi:hypothetical protein
MKKLKPIDITIESRYGGCAVKAVLLWKDIPSAHADRMRVMHVRDVQAATLRLAARMCESSKDELWSIGTDINVSDVDRWTIATSITIEFVTESNREREAAVRMINDLRVDHARGFVDHCMMLVDLEDAQTNPGYR